MAKKGLFPEVEHIISVINTDERQDIVILIIPSHYKENKKDKPLKDQEVWAGAAMDLFADLYRVQQLSRRSRVSTKTMRERSTVTNRS